MISWRGYGYRMIGTADARAAYVRRRYLGAGPLLNLGPGNVGPGESLVGESAVANPAPAPAHVISMHLHTAPPASAPVKLSFHLAGRTLTPTLPTAVTASAPLPALPAPVVDTPDAAPAPDAAPCPTCPPIPIRAAAAGAVGGALLMYVVGLLTREAKKKRRR